MAFNKAAALAATLHQRTEDVEVPELSEFFDEKSKPVWKVRGLKGKEVFKSNSLATISQSNDPTIRKVQELAGVPTGAPEDLVRRVEQIRIATLEPKCDRELGFWLFDNFPQTAMNISNTILSLTGQGAEIEKELKPSGKTQQSGGH